MGEDCIPILLYSTYETLIKSVLMPSCFFAEEKISEIMNRKPFVNWQVLNMKMLVAVQTKFLW